MLDVPLAPDLVPRLRAERDKLDIRAPHYWLLAEFWLADLRAFDADNADARTAIANNEEDRR